MAFFLLLASTLLLFSSFLLVAFFFSSLLALFLLTHSRIYSYPLFSFPNGTDFYKLVYKNRASLVAQTVKHLPAMQETQFQSLGREDPLEKEMATHSSILACKIPWTEEPGGLYSPWGHKEWDPTERLTHTHTQTGKNKAYIEINNKAMNIHVPVIQLKS